jgi:hypothetical protein
MLDALEDRIEELLQVNEDLAARLMKSKKSQEGPAFGLLFPELGTNTEEAEELAAEETTKRKRTPRKKVADPTPETAAAPPSTENAEPEPVPAAAATEPPSAPEPTAASDPTPVAAAEAEPEPTPAAEPAPAAAAEAEPEPAPAAEPALVAAAEAEPEPTPAAAAQAEPEPAPAAAAEPEPAEAKPEPTHAPEQPGRAIAAATGETAMPDWVTAADFEDAPSLPEAAVSEPWTPRPHPWLEFAHGRAVTPTELPHPAKPARHEFAQAAAPAPRPVLVLAPTGASAARTRHPFAEFTGAPLRPQPVSAGRNPSPHDSDVHWSFPAEQDGNRRPESLRKHMESAGLSAEELAAALGVPSAALNGWLSGNIPVPAWVLPSVSVVELVTPAARKEARGTATPQIAPVRKSVSSQTGGRHPFARIEDL